MVELQEGFETGGEAREETPACQCWIGEDWRASHTDTGALQAQPGTVEDLVNFINLQQSLGVLPIVNQLEVPVVSQGVMV